MVAIFGIFLLLAMAQHSYQQAKESDLPTEVDVQAFPPVSKPELEIMTQDEKIATKTDTLTGSPTLTDTDKVTQQQAGEPKEESIKQEQVTVGMSQSKNEMDYPTDPFELSQTALNSTSDGDISVQFVAAVLGAENKCAASVIFDEGYATKMDKIARYLSKERIGYSVQVSAECV